MFYFPPNTLQISHTTLIGHCRLADNHPPPGGASDHGYHTQISAHALNTQNSRIRFPLLSLTMIIGFA